MSDLETNPNHLKNIDIEAIKRQALQQNEIDRTKPGFHAAGFAAETAVRLTLEQLGILEPEHE